MDKVEGSLYSGVSWLPCLIVHGDCAEGEGPLGTKLQHPTSTSDGAVEGERERVRIEMNRIVEKIIERNRQNGE